MVLVTPANVHETLSRWLLAGGLPVVCDLDKSRGAYLRDAKTGKDFLDFASFLAARPLGFNHPKLCDPAFVQHLGRIAVHKPSNSDSYTVEYAQFVDTFASVALGGEFRHVFFVEGGSSAVDNAVRAAFDWKRRKNLAQGRSAQGSQILSFDEACHGHTGYASVLTDSGDGAPYGRFPSLRWPRVRNPKMRFPFDAAAAVTTESDEKQALAAIVAALDSQRDDIAAIIIEPIQAEGGDNYFRSEFLAVLRDLCDERQCLLIFDEVQTGFGATGKWWDWQNHGVKPDLLVFGHKAQVAGFAATERLDEVETAGLAIQARLASTFGGNLVDMVRAERVIQIIVEDHLLDHVATIGKYLRKLLRDQADGSPHLTNVRGRGLWAAFDLPTAADRERLIKACFDEELLVMPCGSRGLRLRPVLDIDADAVGRAAAQLEVAVRRAFGRKP